jgi:hypothetical protein
MIDCLFETRRWLIFAYFRQWFTNYVMPLDWTDLWLTLGCSFYVALQFFQIHFGQNDWKYYLKQVCGLKQKQKLADIEEEGKVAY